MTEGRGASLARRGLLVGMAAALAAPRSAPAQPMERTARVSIYTTASSWRDSIAGVLRERGWIEGRSIAFEWHSAEDSYTRLGEDVARMPPDVIVLGARCESAKRCV
jgi:putative ABC transport system substrate-binding protein